MKTITLWQPYATLVALGLKQHETRSWKTTYRGPVAIHAAKRFNADVRKECYAAAKQLYAIKHPLSDTVGNYRWAESLGTILCVCELADCHAMPHPDQPRFVNDAEPLSETDRLFGDWTPGRFAWRLENVRVLMPPLPFKGGQGLNGLPADVASKVLERIERSA